MPEDMRLVLVALAVTVVVPLQSVGIILSVAMLVTPGATARMLTESIWTMLRLSPAVAAAAVVLGVWAGYVANASSGGMIGVILGLEFVLACAFGPRGAHRRRAKAEA